MSKKVLVVDDDPDILDALRFLLEDAGYLVDTSLKDGEMINKKIKKSPPHLIILDVLLSGHDGRHLCKVLKNQVETKHIPIIMISAHPDADKTAMEAGANAFIAKPFDIFELLNSVEHYI